MEKPFIKLFHTPNSGYFYDVGKNEIIRIPENVYLHLSEVMAGSAVLDQSDDEAVLEMIESFKDLGYVVFVGGIIREANSLEVFLRVFGELRKHIRVVAFSSAKNVEICDALSLHGILYDRNYLESERVFAINNFILNAIREFDAELVLIHVDEALMSFNNSMTNGFGTVPYMVSQVISPDFSICCLPCDYANPEFINGFVQGLEGRYCFSPDVWHVSNVFLDTAVAIDAQDANAVYAPIDSIYKMIQNQKEYGFTIGSMLTEQFLSKCTNDIMKEWRESQLVEVVN